MCCINWQCLYCSFSLELLVWQRHGTLYNNFLGCYSQIQALVRKRRTNMAFPYDREEYEKSNWLEIIFISSVGAKSRWMRQLWWLPTWRRREASRWISAVKIEQWIVYNPILKADVPRLTDSLFHTQYYAKCFIIIKMIWPCPQSKAAAQRTNFLQNTIIKITFKKKLVMNFALRLFRGCFRGTVPKFSENYLEDHHLLDYCFWYMSLNIIENRGLMKTIMKYLP